jgi:hypothetical protein
VDNFSLETRAINIDAKPWYQSKTIVANSGVMLATLLALIVQVLQSGSLPAAILPYAPILLAMINIVLRFLTDKPLNFGPLKPKDGDGGPTDGSSFTPVNPGNGGLNSPQMVSQSQAYQQAFADEVRRGMAKFPAFVVTLLCVTSAIAAQPTAVIRGPEAIETGDILIFDGGQSGGKPTHFDWELSPKIPNRNQIRRSGEGDLEHQSCSEILVAPIPGRYLLRLTVSNADGSSTVFRNVVIPGSATPDMPKPLPTPPNPQPAPQPNPMPGPDPQPAPQPPAVPVFPDGRFGAAKATYDAAMKVASPTRASEAKSLSRALGVISAEIAAGTQTDMQSVVGAVGSALDANTTPAWASARDQLSTMLERLYLAGKLTSAGDLGDLLREACTGLDAVK